MTNPLLTGSLNQPSDDDVFADDETRAWGTLADQLDDALKPAYRMRRDIDGFIERMEDR